MAGVFSFIKHPMLYLLESADGIISGIERAVAVYFDNHQQEVVAKSATPMSQGNTISDYYIASKAFAEKLRREKIQYRWLAAEDLPFETTNTGKTQFNIFDEFERVILCVGFKNTSDGNTDLLFLYLNQNKSNFGVAHSDKPLTTNEKSIIGSITYNSLKMLMERNQADSDTLKLVNQKIQYYHFENEKLKRELNKVKNNYQKSILDHCTEHLEDLSKEFGVDFSFDEEAIAKLKNYHGNIDAVKKQITDAAVLAINLNFGQSTSEIVLRAWDINLPDNVLPAENQLFNQVPERYQKTFQLLEKLESAAQKVVQNQRKLTSENVGNACPTAISAPAITDALRNHQKKVISLMEEFPDNWITIRNEFRPVRNILQNNTG